MIEHAGIHAALEQTRLAPWLQQLPARLAEAYAPERHGDLPGWLEALHQLPAASTNDIDLNAPCIRIGRAEEMGEDDRHRLQGLLRRFHPWRKGPFELFGIRIDSEWRSDWKWARLASHIHSLRGRLVLDVGCGNGYYALRMVGAGARLVVGVDPTLRYVMQYHALRHYLGPQPAHVLPLAFEELPPATRAFDTVFSMGVIYHRKDPLEHLQRLRGCLRPGGELVLEGLVIDGGAGDVLVPQGRYAKMKNVYAIPAPETLAAWLDRAGFAHVRIVDVSATTVEEQHGTDWMGFESLADFLDPHDPRRTVEGHPAPVRAILIAEA